MYLLQLRADFLKHLKAIPLKCNHQEGQEPCLPVSWEERILRIIASEQTALVSIDTNQSFATFHSPDSTESLFSPLSTHSSLL